jgi:formyl-CoA transferase
MSGVMMRRADASVPMSIYPTALCDYTAGMHLVQAVLAALIGVAKTGEGQRVEVSLYDSMIAMQMQEATCHLHSGKEINWAEMPLTGVFATADGALVLVGAFKANPLQDICNVLKIEDLSVDYPDLESQRAGKAYLQDRFRNEFGNESTGYWIERLEAADLLCAPVKNLAEVLEDPQTEANEIAAFASRRRGWASTTPRFSKNSAWCRRPRPVAHDDPVYSRQPRRARHDRSRRQDECG